MLKGIMEAVEVTVSLSMPEKRPGQDVVRVFMDEKLKEKFKRVCQLRGTTMTEEIIQFVETTVDENEDLLKLVDKRLGQKGA